MLQINTADKCTHNAIALLFYNFWYFHFSTSSFLYSCSHPCYCYVYTYLHLYIYIGTFCDTDAIHKMHNNILKSAQCIYHKFCTLVLWKNVFFSFFKHNKKKVLLYRVKPLKTLIFVLIYFYHPLFYKQLHSISLMQLVWMHFQCILFNGAKKKPGNFDATRLWAIIFILFCVLFLVDCIGHDFTHLILCCYNLLIL